MSNKNIDREIVKELPKHTQHELNADPITGEPGSHLIGTSLGTIGGVTTGASIGSIAGPIGAVIGGAIGGVVGGMVGKNAAEVANPTDEEAYWREAAKSMIYYIEMQEKYDDLDYDRDYYEAYRLGYLSRLEHQESSFEDIEEQLRLKWEMVKEKSRLTWAEAKLAVYDAWQRIKHV